MTNESHRVLNPGHLRRCCGGRPSYHDDGNAEGASGGYLAICGLAAAVPRNDEIDAMLGEKASFIEFGKRPAINDVMRFRQSDGRIDRLDAANDVRMLRLGHKRGELLASDRKEDDAWGITNLGDGLLRTADIDPEVTGDGLPGLPLQSNQRQTNFPRCQSRIARDALCERVRGIDEDIDGGVPQKLNKSLGPSEPAYAHFAGMLKGCFCAAGKGERDLEISSRRKLCGEKARFGRSTQNENMPNGHHLF